MFYYRLDISQFLGRWDLIDNVLNAEPDGSASASQPFRPSLNLPNLRSPGQTLPSKL